MLSYRLLRCLCYFGVKFASWMYARAKVFKKKKKKSSKKRSSDTAKQNKVERIKQGMQDNKSKARVKRCKGWLEQVMMRDKEHLANPSDISVRKPLLFLSLVFYHHFGGFLTSKPQV